MTHKRLTIEDLLYMQDKVVEWNKIFGIYPSSKEMVPLYQALSHEEFFGEDEFLESYKKGDHEGILDGCADLAFTVMQWAVMSGYFIRETDKSVLIPPSNVDFEISCLEYEISHKFAWEAQTALMTVLYLLSEKYDILGAFDRVCESNYSKALHKDNSVDIEAEIEYILSQGRYEDITCEESGDYYVFKAGKDLQSGVVFDKGKVVKHSKFVSVEDLGGLSEFVY